MPRAEHGRRERRVDGLGVDVLHAPVEHELVARGAEAHGHAPAQQHEGEDVAVRGPAPRVEGEGDRAVGDGVADEGEPVEDEGGRGFPAGELLVQDVDEDGG